MRDLLCGCILFSYLGHLDTAILGFLCTENAVTQVEMSVGDFVSAPATYGVRSARGTGPISNFKMQEGLFSCTK